MAELITDVLPFAVGVFASPVPVIVAILMLFTPRPRPTSLAYVGTWLLGVAVATGVFALLAGLIEANEQPRAWAAWLRLVLGLLLLVAAVRKWLDRASTSVPGWMSAILDAGPREAVRLGLLMSVANPKELLMAGAAGLAVGSAQAGPAAATVAIVVFVLVGGLSMIAPLAVSVVGGDAAARPLATARGWLERNNAAVTAVVLAALGLFLLVKGLQGV